MIIAIPKGDEDSTISFCLSGALLSDLDQRPLEDYKPRASLMALEAKEAEWVSLLYQRCCLDPTNTFAATVNWRILSELAV